MQRTQPAVEARSPTLTPSPAANSSRFFRLVTLLFVLWSIGAGFTDQAIAAAPVRALRIEQVVDGAPDPRPGRAPARTRQVLTIATDDRKLRLEQFGSAKNDTPDRRFIVRLDREPAVIWEVLEDNKTYREHDGDLNQIQRDRKVRELALIKMARRLPQKERVAILDENAVKLDGSRDVDVQWLAPQEVLGRTCKHLKVTENGRVIIDCFISEDLGGGRSFFNFYRRFGAFSDDVLKWIKDVKGLPLKGSVTVVTKLAVAELSFEVLNIDEVEVDPSTFEYPPGATKEDPSLVDALCSHCDKEGETSSMEKYRLRGHLHYLCGPECNRAFQKKNRKRTNAPDPAEGGEQRKD